jgi:hypothetical protein
MFHTLKVQRSQKFIRGYLTDLTSSTQNGKKIVSEQQINQSERKNFKKN